jgi:hypothetical protein
MSEDVDASRAAAARSTRRNRDRVDRSLQSLPAGGSVPSTDGLLLARLRAGDPDAGRQFIQDYYPGVYRYLLILTIATS